MAASRRARIPGRGRTGPRATGGASFVSASTTGRTGAMALSRPVVVGSLHCQGPQQPPAGSASSRQRFPPYRIILTESSVSSDAPPSQLENLPSTVHGLVNPGRQPPGPLDQGPGDRPLEETRSADDHDVVGSTQHDLSRGFRIQDHLAAVDPIGGEEAQEDVSALRLLGQLGSNRLAMASLTRKSSAPVSFPIRWGRRHRTPRPFPGWLVRSLRRRPR